MTATEFKEIRKRHWKSQSKAAAALGTTQANISHYELGRRPVSGTMIRLLECIENADKTGKEDDHASVFQDK